MRCVCTAIVLAILTVAVAPALAGARDITVTKKLDTLHIDIAPERPVVLMFKSDIVEWASDSRWKVRIAVKRSISTIELYAPKGTSPRQMAGTLLVATRAYTLHIRVKAATQPDPDDVFNIGHADLVSLCDARDQREIDERIASALAKRDAEHAEELATVRIEHQRALADLEIRRAHEVATATERALLREASYTSFQRVTLNGKCEGDSVQICPHAFVNSEERGVLGVWVKNRSAQEFEIARAQVVDLATEIDHAVSFLITDEHDQPVTVIEPGARVKVSVLVDHPKLIGNSVKVVLGGASPVLPAVRQTHIPNMWDWADQERAKQAEEERQLKISREAKRTQVHVMGSYGALFVASGVDDADGTNATSLMGMGARVLVGVSPGLAFEAEIAGGTSGEAGAVQSAQLGRVVLGGRIRRGESTVWHARMGLGLQALRTSTAAGTETEGSPVVALGVGVDWRLGDQLTAGVNAGTSFRGFERIQTIEAGIHLGWVLAP